VLSGQVLNLRLKLFLAFVEEIIAPGNDLSFDVFNFFLLHKLQKWLQVLYIKKCYNVVAESAHLCVSQKPLHIFKSLIVWRVSLQQRNLRQSLILSFIL
jgi:hypothetical protein